jgi:aspartate-semialdehyde dehydrogenase
VRFFVRPSVGDANRSEKADIALFSAGGETSLEWAPKFAAAGTTVIDNSSCENGSN